ncbi:YheC/YheD family protein [Nocardia gipuzkoensis]|uniref:YheC/YheD family protein n=1 Tax=Nocardia gipuzkoensis TaxID=2749991 RepID=UPI003EE0FB11
MFDLIVLTELAGSGRPYGKQTNFFADLEKMATESGYRLGIGDINSLRSLDSTLDVYAAGSELIARSAGRAYYNRAISSDAMNRRVGQYANVVGSAILFNGIASAEAMRDKHYCHLLFDSSGIPVPMSMLTTEINGRLDRLADFGDSLVLKPRSGMQGNGIQFLEREGNRLVAGGESHAIEDLPALFPNHIVQQNVRPASGFEVRTLVQFEGNSYNAVASYVKDSPARSVANLSRGARARSPREVHPALDAKTVETIENNAIAAVEAVRTASSDNRLFEAGVDQIVDDSGRCWIIEINGRPGRFGLSLVAKYSGLSTERDRYRVMRHKSLWNIIEYGLHISDSAK